MNNIRIRINQNGFQFQLNSWDIGVSCIEVPTHNVLQYMGYNIFTSLQDNKWKIWNIVDNQAIYNDKLSRQIQNCYYPLLYQIENSLLIACKGQNWKLVSLIDNQIKEKQISKQIKNLLHRNCMIRSRYIYYSQGEQIYEINIKSLKSSKIIMQQNLYDSYGGQYITAVQTMEHQYLISTKFRKLIKVRENIKYDEKYLFTDMYTLLKTKGQVYNNLTAKLEYEIINKGYEDVSIINDQENPSLQQSKYYLIVLDNKGIKILEMRTYQLVYDYQFLFLFDPQQLIYDYNRHEIIVLVNRGLNANLNLEQKA